MLPSSKPLSARIVISSVTYTLILTAQQVLALPHPLSSDTQLVHAERRTTTLDTSSLIAIGGIVGSYIGCLFLVAILLFVLGRNRHRRLRTVAADLVEAQEAIAPQPDTHPFASSNHAGPVLKSPLRSHIPRTPIFINTSFGPSATREKASSAIPTIALSPSSIGSPPGSHYSPIVHKMSQDLLADIYRQAYKEEEIRDIQNFAAPVQKKNGAVEDHSPSSTNSTFTNATTRPLQQKKKPNKLELDNPARKPGFRGAVKNLFSPKKQVDFNISDPIALTPRSAVFQPGVATPRFPPNQQQAQAYPGSPRFPQQFEEDPQYPTTPRYTRQDLQAPYQEPPTHDHVVPADETTPRATQFRQNSQPLQQPPASPYRHSNQSIDAVVDNGQAPLSPRFNRKPSTPSIHSQASSATVPIHGLPASPRASRFAVGDFDPRLRQQQQPLSPTSPRSPHLPQQAPPQFPMKPIPASSPPTGPSAVRANGELPFRAFQNQGGASQTVQYTTTKETVLRAPRSPNGPSTGVPYTPYQPNTPVIPMTPTTLLTRKDKKAMKVPKTPVMEMVPQEDEVW